MSKKLRTPIIMPRKQGGTFYTFGSAMEDIGLNVNESHNKVEISHYVLLDIPKFSHAESSSQDPYLNLNTNLSYDSPQYTSGEIPTQGDFIFAESFQNYCLNFETILRNQDTYNYASNKTVSERVFWKWLFGHIANDDGRWVKTEPINNIQYLYENKDKSIVKGFGSISAGSQRTDDSGLYNETFVQIPSSYGQMRVMFKNVIDENYHNIAGDSVDNYVKGTNINNYIENISQDEMEYGYVVTFVMTYNYYDYPEIGTTLTDEKTNAQLTVLSSNKSNKRITAKFKSDRVNIDSTGSLIFGGEGSLREYSDLICDVHDYVLKSTGISPEASSDSYDPNEEDVPRYRIDSSKNDCLEVEFDINKLRQIYDSSSLTYDDIGMGKINDPDYISADYGDYTFNAILVYYSIYDANKTKRLATNAYGLYILDNSIYTNQDDSCFYFPSLVKSKSTTSKTGSSYSFRINVKPTTAYNGDTIVNDNSTAAYVMSEDFNDVLHNLTSAIVSLQENTKVMYSIVKKNNELKTMTENIMGKVDSLEQDISTIKNGTSAYTPSEIYKDESENPSELTPYIARKIIECLSVTYDEHGNIGMKLNVEYLDGEARTIGNKIRQSINNKNYIDLISIISILAANR